ncbi:hypothetical protein T4B_3020 [Trichinella pseudospiralis]|uniref:Uncharacterized protein n=1 Tax=Trichinella pseudospiralis TaxID=6337 RepID=A0A0V1GTX2_TRIPS|nr:hypothetical protein T4B_3020 [Trichinella pseudospiralis]KRZ01586.1 hypothetical protein T4C_10218 [Trichinella pseudospiralis]
MSNIALLSPPRNESPLKTNPKITSRATRSPCFKKARDRHYYQANTHSDKANADEPS